MVSDHFFCLESPDHQSSYFDFDSRTEAETKAKIGALLDVKKSNSMHRNRGGDRDGEPLTFEDVTTAWGAYVATATEFRSCYLENQGKVRFAIHPLPMLAQMAPVFGMLTDDYDGNLDRLLAGNFYATDVFLKGSAI